ncbi:MAG: HlyD family secretion protein [Roseiarcus sp.]
MATRRRIILLVAAAVLVVGGAGAAYRFPGPIRQFIGPSADAELLLVSGNIEAHESVVSFKTVQSRIVELPFDEGQWVKQGALLARVEASDYRQQVVIAQAALDAQRRQLAVAEQNVESNKRTVVSDEADLELKRLEFDRAQALLTKGAGTTEVRDEASAALKQSTAALDRDRALEDSAILGVTLAQANVQSADAALAMANIVLGYTTLTAPFDGVVLVRQAELGEVALPGAPVVTLADIDHVWLRAYINETDIGKVRYAETATVTTDTYPGKKYQGRIAFIASSAEFTPKSVETHEERVSLVYRIRIDIDNPSHELVPGMPADAQIRLLPAGPS